MKKKPQLDGIREWTPEERKYRAEEREQTARVRALNKSIAAAPRKKRKRVRNRFRHCISITPRAALFFRMQFGGPEESLSKGIEAAGRFLYRLALEDAQALDAEHRMTKKQRNRMKSL